MPDICVICTLNRPPLLPLAIEHRKLLEAIVSPVINMSDLKACHLLLCMECQVKMLSIHQFQKKALQGVRNLKYILCKVNIVPPSLQPIGRVEHEDMNPGMIRIKTEPGTKSPANEDITYVPSFPSGDSIPPAEKQLKMEPQRPPELVPLARTCDLTSVVGTEPVQYESRVERPTTSTLTTKPSQTKKAPNLRNRVLTRRTAANATITANAAKYRARLRNGGVRSRKV